MARGTSYRETEIKLRIDSAASMRRALRRLGFLVETRRVFETNVLFDTTDAGLRQKRTLLRLREAGGEHVVTFKGPPANGRYKSREEIEFGLSDAAGLTKILANLGYKPVFRYEKFRTVFHRPGRPERIMLDETPIGDFVEIEGPPRSIDRTARELGYSADDYITSSYGRLYLEHCEQLGVTPRNFVFRRRK